MPETSVPTLLQWVNMPLFYVGQTPITLGGIGTSVFIVLFSLFVSAIIQRTLISRLEKGFGLRSGLVYAIGRTLHYFILLLGVVVAAQCLGLNLGSLAVVLGFLSVGIGFGLQNITSNFISGLILLFERPIGVGDLITFESTSGSMLGKVTQIGLRATHVKTMDNITIIVPNSQFIENAVTNWTHSDPKVRIRISVGVAYGSDLEKVQEALLAVAKAHSAVLADPSPEVRFIAFGNSSLNLELLVWIDKPEKQFVFHSQLNFAVDEAFREAGVQIPFPQRDIHVQMTPAIQRLSDNQQAA